MCTNRALVNSLECYMDELVDNFEDFVKKSLLLISLAVGTIVLIFMYILKILNDRTGTSDAGAESRVHHVRRVPSVTAMQSTRPLMSHTKCRKSDSRIKTRRPELVSSSVNTLSMPPVPSYDERILNDFKYSNEYPKNCEMKKRPCSKYSASRITIPSLPTCISKQRMSPTRNCLKMLKRTSCCSMCCDDNRSDIL